MPVRVAKAVGPGFVALLWFSSHLLACGGTVSPERESPGGKSDSAQEDGGNGGDASLAEDDAWRGRRAIIDAEWQNVRPAYADLITAYAAGPRTLYDAQVLLGNFTYLASSKRDAVWLRQLMVAVSNAEPHLKTITEYPMRWVGTVQLLRPMRLWLDSTDHEVPLETSQFLYLVTTLLHDAGTVAGVAGTQEADDFLETYLDVATRDHLLRWIFDQGSNSGSFGGRWTCESHELYSHEELVTRLQNNATGSYCNAVSDIDMFVAESALHLLALYDRNPKVFADHAPEVTAADMEKLRGHVTNVWTLIYSRMSFRMGLDRAQVPVEVGVFDPGAYTDYPDQRYAGYGGSTHPLATPVVQLAPQPGLGWDISHGRRLVSLLDSYDRLARDLSSPPVPPGELSRMRNSLANCMAYVVFGGDLTWPTFSNYLDGTDGWYRPSKSAGGQLLGYEPGNWAIGRSFITGGYGVWARDNSDLIDVWYAAKTREDALEEAVWMPIGRSPFDRLAALAGEPAPDFLKE